MSDMSQEDALKMLSTPSPTASNSAGSSSASRRPPRKSTLTQQQKNQKRQRATQDQLVTLEMEFNKNPTPTATVRERIAEDITMTERSVQIWFQNRRAKIKLMAKKSIETGETCEIPETMRQYLAIQEMESGKSLGGNFLGRGGLMPYGSGNMLMGGDHGPQGKVVIHHLSCRSLSIGSWRRIGQNAMDLIIFYSPDKSTMTYYINNDQAGYKIEYPFSSIKNIYLENGDNESRPGGLVVELIRAPNFFMDSSGSGGFYQCGDFTEDQQASQVMVHHLGGHPKVLSGQLAKLVSLESFITRDNPFTHQQPLSISAPASPTGLRPSSQPNFNAQAHVGMFQESQWGIGVHPSARGPGHRRQRSRSVPMAVDFSMFNNPMPSFLIQHPGENQHQHQHQHGNPNIFAPIPQQPNNLGPLGPNLRIDTSSGYGMDFRQYPMSAATTTSPSDYASPGFFPHHNDNGPMTGPMPTSSSMPDSNFTPYSMPYLSPDPSSLVPPSVSPLSFMSHGDPAIVDQSPPMSMMHRSASADVYSMHNDSAISDDGTGLNEMYQKHTLNIPMHPHSPAFGEQSAADMDMSNLVQFPVDHDGLSPEHMPQ
ncbi:putative homeobox domain-containing protein [Botrytis fragariae]|uniref:Putative homeobox domain-containing protein n=1 Tax=Botrytis fragariae TaxID=1964551 RepID=A0A8H6B0X8_9HELO|nr:putative homeobox domain-containing protein [Botrytis fragariae]KAF5877144.1 putative homeobox domain-containing protein [Botrytis fragariae]